MDTRPVLGGEGIAYSTLFPFYLIEKSQPGQVNKGIIKQIWERYAEPQFQCGPMKPVIDSILPRDGKISDIFPKYAEANYFLAYPPPPDIRGALQARNWPQDFRPARDERHDLSDLNPQVIGPRPEYRGVKIEFLGAAYAEFHNEFIPKDKGRALRLSIAITASNLSASPVVKVWTVTQFPVPANAVPVAVPIPLAYQNGTYTGATTILNFDSSQVRWVAMNVTNPQTSGSSLSNWRYQADILAPTPTPTPTRTSTIIPTSTPTP